MNQITELNKFLQGFTMNEHGKMVVDKPTKGREIGERGQQQTIAT